MHSAAPASGESERPLSARSPALSFTNPTADDAPAIQRMAKEAGGLDVNSMSFYRLWCRDFAETSVIARVEGVDRGFITGFTRPASEDTLFVWQAAVLPAARGTRLAGRMLEYIAGRRFRFVEATVSPGNTASKRFLAGFAESRNAPLTTSPLFGPEHLPADHDDEDLVRIGPLDEEAVSTETEVVYSPV